LLWDTHKVWSVAAGGANWSDRSKLSMHAMQQRRWRERVPTKHITRGRTSQSSGLRCRSHVIPL